MAGWMQRRPTVVDLTQDWEATEAVFSKIYNAYSRMYSSIKLHTGSLNFSVNARRLAKNYWSCSEILKVPSLLKSVTLLFYFPMFMVGLEWRFRCIRLPKTAEECAVDGFYS